jgi:hypothetical protein
LKPRSELYVQFSFLNSATNNQVNSKNVEARAIVIPERIGQRKPFSKNGGNGDIE